MQEWPLTAGKDGVSGPLSSPCRGAFHLSLTVLVHYRSLKVLSLGGWSPQLPTNSPGFVVLRIPVGAAAGVPYGTLTVCGGAFQHLWVPAAPRAAGPTTPPVRTREVWAPPRSLATTRGISVDFFSRGLLRCFSSPTCLRLPMDYSGGRQTSLWRGCPIGNLRAHRSHAAPPERFAGLRVLHRPSAPRHPPRPLLCLFLFFCPRQY